MEIVTFSQDTRNCNRKQKKMGKLRSSSDIFYHFSAQDPVHLVHMRPRKRYDMLKEVCLT